MGSTVGQPLTKWLAASVANARRSAVAIPAAIAGFAFLVRVPFLGHGYGADPDAWLAIRSARRLIETGDYIPSRPPGYPVPEFLDAGMLYLGLDSFFAIGLLSALVAALAAPLFYFLLAPLGTNRATAGALALTFTPVVFIAGTSAMDYIFGLTLFLGATLAAVNRRILVAAVLLGLAVGCRSSYAFAFIPIALLLLDGDVRRIRTRAEFQSLFIVAAVSGTVALVCYVPALITTGLRTPTAYRGLLYLVFNSSAGLFGAIGVLCVGTVVIGTIVRQRRGVVNPEVAVPLGRAMNAWAIATIVVYALLFGMLPDEASYLMPALAGLYWLLARYAAPAGTWATVAAVALSCFLIRLTNGEDVIVSVQGPVLVDVEKQLTYHCIADVIEQRRDELAREPIYVVSEIYKPSLIQLVPEFEDRFLYLVKSRTTGGFVDTEGRAAPPNAKFWVLDRVRDEQSELGPLPEDSVVVDTYTDCSAPW